MVGGPEGSTSGMRFNPRESAEELQEDSNVGREDSEERAIHDAKKRDEQDKRNRLMQGLQHMKIKIPQKNPEDEEDSDMKQQAELGQMTGQVGQNEAIDGANPNASGLGGGMSNLLLSTTNYIDEAFEMIRKKKDEPKFDSDKPQKTTTIETVRARERAKTGKKRKARKNVTAESIKRRRRKKGGGVPLKAGNVRQTGYASVMSAARAPYASFGGGYTYRQRTAPIRVGGATGRSRAKQAYSDPRQREAEAMRQQMRQSQPTQDITPPIPTVTPEARIPRAVRGSRDSRPKHKKAMRQPRTASTPGGKELTEHISLGGGASAMASGGVGSSESILASEEFLIKRAQKLKLNISPRDKIEYRQLIDQLNHLLRRLMYKEDKSMQGAEEKSSPNSSGGLSSNPTGATETDPDDDATRWGAHPYDLYVRRGGIN